jgi:hypothetical protein
MSDPLFGSDSPLELQVRAHLMRDRYLADLARAGIRALWTRLFGTRQTAHDAAVVLHDCYVLEQGLTRMPDPDALEARRSNDHFHHAA